LGKTVYVELSEAEKNIEASSDVRASTRIYAVDLHLYNIKAVRLL